MLGHNSSKWYGFTCKSCLESKQNDCRKKCESILTSLKRRQHELDLQLDKELDRAKICQKRQAIKDIKEKYAE